MTEEQHRLALPRGTRIDDFEFHRVLGHGGFGLTYLGWNLRLDIPVAIKEYLPSDLAVREQDLSVVPKSSSDASDFQWGLARFVDEARTLARFQHPNIVRVHHFFEAHGTAYIAMEYAEGETLSARLARRGTLREAELLGLVLPLLDGLAVVHGENVLHRDIKPGNIIIRDADGSPVLLDFGSARQAIGAKSRSVTSVVTPGYAPIEQYSTRGAQGAWTDLYALGGVCYRALTGQVPADATDRVRRDPLVPIGQLCVGQVSAGLLSAVDWALQVEESARPQSVEAWREALWEGALVGEGVGMAAAVPTASEPVAVAAERSDSSGRPSAAPAASAVPVFGRVFWVVLGLCLVGLVGLGGYWGLGQIEEARQEQAAAEQQAATARERAEEAARQAALERERQAAAQQALAVAQAAAAERQAALERERKAEAARQAALEQERQAAAERERKAAAERQAALERERKALARQAEVERQRQAAKQDRKAAAARQAELERERKEAARQAEAERKRAAEASAARRRKARKAGTGKTFSLPGGVEMAFVWIPLGRFQMGSPSRERGRDDDEGPVHEVEISRGFWLGTYEVTQGQWESVMGSRPWRGEDYVRSNSSHPAVYISWNDVQRFIKKLNAASGDSLYRLPSEAEWEYACRAGSKTGWLFGDDESQLTDYAWYRANAWNAGKKYAQAVGQKRTNGWGLYDMHGNVREWVQAWYDEDYYRRSPRVAPPGPTSGSLRVVRGGAFYNVAQHVRSAARGGNSPGHRASGIGVRLLRISTP